MIAVIIIVIIPVRSQSDLDAHHSIIIYFLGEDLRWKTLIVVVVAVFVFVFVMVVTFIVFVIVAILVLFVFVIAVIS